MQLPAKEAAWVLLIASVEPTAFRYLFVGSIQLMSTGGSAVATTAVDGTAAEEESQAVFGGEASLRHVLS